MTRIMNILDLFLANAMVNLKMMDTIGSGIIRIFNLLKKRHFPMPDYDLSQPEKVTVRIYGKILDENYTRMLINNTDLDLKTVIYLDKVQKNIKLSKEEYKILKDQKFVEGRYPNIYVVVQIAAVSGDKSSYIKNRAFDDMHYKKMMKPMMNYHFKEAWL